MLPLLNKSEPIDTDLNNTKWKYFSKVICIISILIFIPISIISYFHSSTNITNNNTNKSLYNKQSKSNLNPATTSEYYNANGYDDEILSMPNLDPLSCSLSITNCEFKQYSGYLLATNNNEIHYWFIEADTYDDPTTKPLFFWTNGGPGCSGLDGLLTEHGPWRVMNDLTIEYNKYSWITEVNMIYLEQPYGVGFSVADNNNVVAGDINAANDMDAVIRNFLIKFPQYKDNLVYLSSESWGGHYVPITTYTILQNNDNGYIPYINFGGFLLGNPYTDFYENTYGFVGDIYGHGLMMGQDWDEWRNICWDNEYNIDNNPICSAIYTRAYMSSYNANVYALDWPQCTYDMNWDIGNNIPKWNIQKASHLHEHAKKFILNVLNHPNYNELNMNINKDELNDIYNTLINKQSGVLKRNNNNKIKSMDTNSNTVSSDTYLPCIEYNMANYLNLDEVQTALNVKRIEWEMCNNNVWNDWPETDYDTFIQTYYNNIINEYSNNNMKLCIYSGDDDSVCGLQGTQYWLDRWNGYEMDKNNQWLAWSDEENELAGYYTKYISVNDNNNIPLHFITVRTGGHMVPTTQPQRALILLKKYLYEFQ